jgi:hypothetical protein
MSISHRVPDNYPPAAWVRPTSLVLLARSQPDTNRLLEIHPDSRVHANTAMPGGLYHPTLVERPNIGQRTRILRTIILSCLPRDPELFGRVSPNLVSAFVPSSSPLNRICVENGSPRIPTITTAPLRKCFLQTSTKRRADVLDAQVIVFQC